jgi:AraC family transcriptional regulator
MLVYNAGSLASHTLQFAPLHGPLGLHALGRGLWVQIAQLASVLPLVVLLRRRLRPEVLKQVEEYVAALPDDNLSLSDVAARVHLSPFHFARLFKATTGKTLHEYILGERLRRAYDLLLTTDLPLDQVANDLGFADESHFVRCFKTQFGVTPGAVRRRGQP